MHLIRVKIPLARQSCPDVRHFSSPVNLAIAEQSTISNSAKNDLKTFSPAVRTIKNQSVILAKTYGPLPVTIRSQSESENDVVTGQIKTGAIYLASLLVFLWWWLGH